MQLISAKYVTTEEPIKFDTGKRDCKRFFKKQTNIAGEFESNCVQIWLVF